MEAAIGTLISKFKEHAGTEGSNNSLSQAEFHDLVKSELSNYVKNASDPRATEELMGRQDKDNDGELTFTEFWQLLGMLASEQGGFCQ
ncbi:uncharacterized protein V6R79_019917 [Siganus canaliculatus]